MLEAFFGVTVDAVLTLLCVLFWLVLAGVLASVAWFVRGCNTFLRQRKHARGRG